MGEHEKRAAAVGQDDLLEEGLEVADIVVEALDVAAMAVTQQPLGSTLATPVEGRHRMPTHGQVADGLEIFLDAFVAAVEQDHRALEGLAGRRKQAVAQALAVMGDKVAGLGALGNRIAGDFVEQVRHQALRNSLPGIRLQLRVIERVAAKIKGIPTQAGIQFTVLERSTGQAALWRWPQTMRPEATCGLPPASVDPGGRDVTTRFGLMGGALGAALV